MLDSSDNWISATKSAKHNDLRRLSFRYRRASLHESVTQQIEHHCLMYAMELKLEKACHLTPIDTLSYYFMLSSLSFSQGVKSCLHATRLKKTVALLCIAMNRFRVLIAYVICITISFSKTMPIMSRQACVVLLGRTAAD